VHTSAKVEIHLTVRHIRLMKSSAPRINRQCRCCLRRATERQRCGAKFPYTANNVTATVIPSREIDAGSG